MAQAYRPNRPLGSGGSARKANPESFLAVLARPPKQRVDPAKAQTKEPSPSTRCRWYTSVVSLVWQASAVVQVLSRLLNALFESPRERHCSQNLDDPQSLDTLRLGPGELFELDCPPETLRPVAGTRRKIVGLLSS
jgi:hypothetical protein